MSASNEWEQQAIDAAVVVALGSNLKGEYDSVRSLLTAAILALDHAGLPVLRRSRWWRSSAWPDPDEPAYLNGVAIVDTTLRPREVMDRLRQIERDFGRERRRPNAPRTLDLDLIAWGRLRIEDATLSLPHPRASERKFVMAPLAEILPGWRHPVLGTSAADLALVAPVGADAAVLEEAS